MYIYKIACIILYNRHEANTETKKKKHAYDFDFQTTIYAIDRIKKKQDKKLKIHVSWRGVPRGTLTQN